MISAIRKVMRFHASQPRPPNFSTCSLHSFRASPAAIFLPRVAGWHGFDDWLHRWMVYIWKLRCESFVEEEDDWFPGENSFQTPITSSLSLSLSLSLSSFSLYGDHSAKTPCCQDFAGSYSPELADVQIAEPLSQHLYPVFPRRPNRITIAKRKFSH